VDQSSKKGNSDYKRKAGSSDGGGRCIGSFLTGVLVCQSIADGRPRAVVWRRFQLHHVTHQLVQVHVHKSTGVERGATFEICTHGQTRSTNSYDTVGCSKRLIELHAVCTCLLATGETNRCIGPLYRCIVHYRPIGVRNTVNLTSARLFMVVNGAVSVQKVINYTIYS